MWAPAPDHNDIMLWSQSPLSEKYPTLSYPYQEQLLKTILADNLETRKELLKNTREKVTFPKQLF